MSDTGREVDHSQQGGFGGGPGRRLRSQAQDDRGEGEQRWATLGSGWVCPRMAAPKATLLFLAAKSRSGKTTKAFVSHPMAYSSILQGVARDPVTCLS